EVRALAWDQAKPPTQNDAEVSRINNLPGGRAILDNRTLNLGTHHQKILIVNGSEGLIAFCGGLDVNPDRLHPTGSGPNQGGGPGSPLDDVHCRIRGPAADSLLLIFRQGWPDHPVNDTAE